MPILQNWSLTRSRAERGCELKAMYNLTANYFFGDSEQDQDLDMARIWFQKAAELGCARSSYQLARFYLEGLGGHADSTEGLRWLHIASDKGCVAATTVLAQIYLAGNFGVSRDIEKGERLLQMGIDAGDDKAMQLWRLGK